MSKGTVVVLSSRVQNAGSRKSRVREARTRVVLGISCGPVNKNVNRDCEGQAWPPCGKG